MSFFDKLKGRFKAQDQPDTETTEHLDYVEVAPESEEPQSKIMVRPFVIEDFEQIKPILDVLRDGKTIALINIKPLRDKDLVELKRAINKLKKTCDAVEGDIAGFGDDWIAITPSFAGIYRGAKKKPEQKEEMRQVSEYDDDI